MRSATKGAWRSIRCLLLLTCAGGVLAADNTWVGSMNLNFAGARNWFWSEEDSSAMPAVFDYSVADRPRTEMSMTHLLNGLLFSRSPGGRTLATLTGTSNSLVASRSDTGFVVQSDGDNFLETRSASTVWARGPVSGGGGGEIPTALAATGSWIGDSPGTQNWSNAANWSGGVVADGAGSTANITFNITGARNVNLDTSRTIGSVLIGDTDGSHSYTMTGTGGASLTFDNGSNSATLTQTANSAGDTISAPILLATSLDVANLSATNPLTISGNISSNATGFLFLSFTGNVNVSGNIGSGVTGASLSVGVNSGVTTFTGTNTYNGSTSVQGGTLLVNGDNSGADGTTFVSGSGSVLGGTGTIGNGTVQTFDGTITGATTTTVGSLTFLGNVDLSTGEGTGTYLANLSGSMSDLLAITGTLSLGQGSILDIDGAGDGITTYTLATFASRDDVFGSVMDIPGGYTLVYHDMDIQLVPTAIPEPGTWAGATFALGAMAFAQRRRRRAQIKE